MGKDLNDKEKLSQVLGIHESEEIETFNAWNEAMAKKTARAMGLKLKREHWEVIDFLRVNFQNVGAAMPPVHELSQILNERFSAEGGLRYLYSLFPDGPLIQGSRIAGIPVPDDATNSSFGSIH